MWDGNGLGFSGASGLTSRLQKKPGVVLADGAYLRESILDPHAKTVKVFEKGEYAMPSDAGLVTDSQLELLVLFIKSLKKTKEERR
jgi:hypothetical protein